MKKRNLVSVPKQGAPATASGVLQRKCACGQHAGGTECEECHKKKQVLQRKGTSTDPMDVPAVVEDTLRSPSQPLDARTRAVLEPRFDHDFSRVRVHTDAKAAESVRAVNALAYTVGRDVVFGAGQYAPDTTAGFRLMAHELSHVVQQSRALEGTNPQGNLEIGRPGDVAEREADRAAEEVASESASSVRAERRLVTQAAMPSLQRQQPGSTPPAPHSLGMRPKGPSALDLLMQNDRIDSFLTSHKFAVGPKLQPLLDGQPTTLDAVIDAAVQPLLLPIPRSAVEARVRSRWLGMVYKVLFPPLSLQPVPLASGILAPLPNFSTKSTPPAPASWSTFAAGVNYAWHVNLSGPPGKSTDSTLFLQLGEEGRFQRVFQISYNVNNQQFQIIGGGQATTGDLVLVKNLLKLSGFAQIVGGVAATGSPSSGSFLILQPSIGGQATLTFGPVEFSLQVSPSATFGQGQPTTGDINLTPQVLFHF